MDVRSLVSSPLRSLVAGLAAAVLIAVAGSAADPPVTADARVERGAESFRVYCANCHGLAGKGDGPTAAYLTIEPGDLTRIAERNGGKFPESRVREVIDGRTSLRGHGTREMPIWGLAFQRWDLDAGQEDEVASKIDDLVAYVASIQAGR
jgi:mono/diheme cytochrome c family protein